MGRKGLRSTFRGWFDELPPSFNSRSGVLRIVGPAETWTDYTILPPGDTMVVNGSASLLKADFWASKETEVFTRWSNTAFKISGDSWIDHRVDEWWKFKNPTMFSGVYATLVGVMLGYDRVYIAGMPADYTIPYAYGEVHPPQDISVQYEGWKKYIDLFENVRVLGGNLPIWFPFLKFDPQQV